MEPVLTSRRDWLKAAGLAAVGAGIGGGLTTSCATRRATARTFARVDVSPGRVTRTVVGLRPFRPHGFRVETQPVDKKKTIIHNYGHGGGGMTLSWGTSYLAMEEAFKTGHTRYAVIGCGGVGLATARLLQGRGFDVTIYARDLPPNTTSNVACAQWSPASIADPTERTDEWMRVFVRAARISYRLYQNFLGTYYGVRWIRNYEFSDDPPEARPEGVGLAIRDLYPETRMLGPDEHPFKFKYVKEYWTMFIEPPVYLNAVLRDFLLAGGKIVVRDFSSLDELLALPEPVIMNCTGIGAKALFDDEELTPIKGQLTVLLPQPDVDYIMISGGLYMMPRRDGVLLGGTHEQGEWSLQPNPVEAKRVMDGHIDFFTNKMA